VLIGVTGGSANLLLTQSYKLSEVSLVAPLRYLSLIFAIIFGYLIWNEVPTMKTLIGAFLVIFASLIIFRREIYHKQEISSANRHE
jgi:drug/metabolite transporter (DMT)-like permease